METKHTKGKWTTGNELKTLVGVNETGVFVAICNEDNDIPNYEQEANAKLIAAAPELLEMCIKCLLHLEVSNIEIGLQFDLKNVIRKATK